MHNNSKIDKIGCSEITKSLECHMKGSLTFVGQEASLKALNRKMSFGKNKLAVIHKRSEREKLGGENPQL